MTLNKKAPDFVAFLVVQATTLRGFELMFKNPELIQNASKLEHHQLIYHLKTLAIKKDCTIFAIEKIESTANGRTAFFMSVCSCFQLTTSAKVATFD